MSETGKNNVGEKNADWKAPTQNQAETVVKPDKESLIKALATRYASGENLSKAELETLDQHCEEVAMLHVINIKAGLPIPTRYCFSGTVEFTMQRGFNMSSFLVDPRTRGYCDNMGLTRNELHTDTLMSRLNQELKTVDLTMLKEVKRLLPVYCTERSKNIESISRLVTEVESRKDSAQEFKDWPFELQEFWYEMTVWVYAHKSQATAVQLYDTAIVADRSVLKKAERGYLGDVEIEVTAPADKIMGIVDFSQQGGYHYLPEGYTTEKSKRLFRRHPNLSRPVYSRDGGIIWPQSLTIQEVQALVDDQYVERGGYRIRQDNTFYERVNQATEEILSEILKDLARVGVVLTENELLPLKQIAYKMSETETARKDYYKEQEEQGMSEKALYEIVSKGHFSQYELIHTWAREYLGVGADPSYVSEREAFLNALEEKRKQ